MYLRISVRHVIATPLRTALVSSSAASRIISDKFTCIILYSVWVIVRQYTGGGSGGCNTLSGGGGGAPAKLQQNESVLQMENCLNDKQKNWDEQPTETMTTMDLWMDCKIALRRSTFSSWCVSLCSASHQIASHSTVFAFNINIITSNQVIVPPLVLLLHVVICDDVMAMTATT